MENNKILSIKKLPSVVKQLKSESKKIVFTNGCFDILHRGHVDYLKKAKALGDILVVGLNSDASVKRLKGPKRPINSQNARAVVLAGLESVDYVVIFNEDTPYRLIKAIEPYVIAKGGDWKPKDIVGADIVKSYGGKVVSVPFARGYSTTGLIKKLCGDRFL